MGFPTTAPDIPLSTIGELLSNLGGGAGLIPHLNKIRTEVLAMAAKYGTGAGAAAANTVLRGTGAGTSAFGQVVAGDLAAGAIGQIGSDTGGGDTNTGTVGTLANITSVVRTLTIPAGSGGLAIFMGSFTDSVSQANVTLAMNITGLGDIGTGADLFAMPATPFRGLGVVFAPWSGISGSVTFQPRFGRGAAAGTLTLQQGRLDVFGWRL